MITAIRELTPDETQQVGGGLPIGPILTAFTIVDAAYDFFKGVEEGFSRTAN